MYIHRSVSLSYWQKVYTPWPPELNSGKLSHLDKKKKICKGGSSHCVHEDMGFMSDLIWWVKYQTLL